MTKDYTPDTKWSEYPGDTLYLWNGDVLYTATEDHGYNLSNEDIQNGYKDSWIVDIYSLSGDDWIPQGGQWMENDLIANKDYTINGIGFRLCECDLWGDDWTIVDPEVGELMKLAFEKMIA